MLFAESIGYDMYVKKEVSILSWFLYLTERFSGVHYDSIAKDNELGDDPTAIINAFITKGRKDFKRWVIKDAGLISTFLSCTTYSILKYKPICFRGFRVPDVYPYITTRGMSYKVVSGYEVNENTRLLFGFERVFYKEQATEYSIGVDRIGKLSLPIHYKCNITFGLGLDLECSITVPVSSYFSEV
jgi:hypothetical protein